ncbi:MAG: HAMP domain-containing histidine kinase [Streptomyces sp.]|nr:HAMP domain-containing histidine kinase [Streptomyces sp.]
MFLGLETVLLATVYLGARAGILHGIDRVGVRYDKVVDDPATLRAHGTVATLRRAHGTVQGAQPAEKVSHALAVAAADEVLWWSIPALGVTALIAIAVGWWAGKRALRPVHAMTAKARQISEHSLDQRIGLDGPDDELKRLADTFDDLLGRLDAAFDSQRRFVANASHELRTPLAVQRAAIQIGLEGEPGPEELAYVRGELLAANRRSERLIDGLLLLAHSDRGLEHREPVDMAAVVADELVTLTEEARDARVEVRVAGSGPAPLRGDPVLLGHLVGNLLRNAVRHNHPGGCVEVSVTPGALTVRNTGPHVPADQVQRLFEPFRRGTRERTRGPARTAPGSGLGLSIVRSIAHAHGGTVTAEPVPDGGLLVRAALPPADENRAGRAAP